jgi:hypothetical protein
MACRFLGELEARRDAELGVNAGEVGFHGARRHEKPGGDVFVGQCFNDQPDDVALGWVSEAQPLAGRLR